MTPVRQELCRIAHVDDKVARVAEEQGSCEHDIIGVLLPLPKIASQDDGPSKPAEIFEANPIRPVYCIDLAGAQYSQPKSVLKASEFVSWYGRKGDQVLLSAKNVGTLLQSCSQTMTSGVS